VAEEKAGLVRAMFDEYGGVTRAALRDYLPDREPRKYLYDLLADYPGRVGKMMRPSICIAAARMFGGQTEEVLHIAVAIELFHNALLIHDDIEDGSEQRRGRPSLHRLHGVPLALNTGDALALIALRPLFEARSRIGEGLWLRLLDELQRMGLQCAEGQAIDLGWRQHNALAIDEGQYLEMVLKKTCWLGTIFPLRAGALIGSRGRIDPDVFVRFGFFMGAAFQIQDDLLNLCGDHRYGKEREGDLWEGKRTLMMIRVLRESTDEERERLRSILGRSRSERTAQEVAWMRQLIDKYQAIRYARQMAQELAGAALHEFDLIAEQIPDSRDKVFLHQMPLWVIERT
jgi:geranylgeranyl diphosphate synthase type II